MTIKRLLLMVLAVGVLLVVSGVAYLQHPVFGQPPEGERLATIQASPNYRDREFRNLIETPMLTTDQSRFSMMLENILNGSESTHPGTALPTEKVDLQALDSREDQVIWLGHSSYFVQLAGQRILIDPIFSANASPVPRTNLAFEGTHLYTAEELPPIDILLITHDHYDHLDYPSMLALEPNVQQVITGLGIGAHLERWGYDMSRVIEADWYERIEILPELDIVVTPARHYSGRTFKRNQTLWVGFALLSSETRLFFSGDTGYGPHFSELGQAYGPFDWVTLDAGQYDPRWANIHMNPEQAVQAANDLQARAMTPKHVGRFSLSPHAWDDPFVRLADASQGQEYALWTPTIGQPMYLDQREQSFSRWREEVR
ncbi:MBL fold metallo-hydrolase [Vreelandella venusta]|uniref:MBL fold metallo-hydrolase n=1 Tax=Vreelandella venusta TaxID=44935 RepID=UPI00384FE64B